MKRGGTGINVRQGQLPISRGRCDIERCQPEWDIFHVKHARIVEIRTFIVKITFPPWSGLCHPPDGFPMHGSTGDDGGDPSLTHLRDDVMVFRIDSWKNVSVISVSPHWIFMPPHSHKPIRGKPAVGPKSASPVAFERVVPGDVAAVRFAEATSVGTGCQPRSLALFDCNRTHR
jgi:hypothetical protein